MADILIMDDDRQTVTILASLLKTEGFVVSTCGDTEACREMLKKNDCRLLLVNLRCTFDEARDFVDEVRDNYPEMPVIMAASRDEASGLCSDPRAITYVAKPFKIDNLIVTVQDVFEAADSTPEEQRQVMEQLLSFYQKAELVALSAPMQRVAQIVERIAATEIPVFLQGENGTDKELTARAIHHKSRHSQGAFVVYSCKDGNEGKMEDELFGGERDSAIAKAGVGTLMIDGLEHLSKAAQKGFAEYLARVRQQKDQTHPRLITASEMNAVELSKTIDPVLTAPLTAMPLLISPLRERREDILPLARMILQRQCEGSSPCDISNEAAKIIEQHKWPGNVNELASVIGRALQKARQNNSNLITPAEINC